MLKNRPKNSKELHKFGLTMAAVLVVIGAFTFWKGHTIWMAFGGLGAAFLIVALVQPMLLRPIEKGWMKIALYLSMVVTTILLSIVYYLVLTPIGLFMRKVLRKDLLKLKWDQHTGTYWDPAEQDGPGSRPYKPF